MNKKIKSDLTPPQTHTPAAFAQTGVAVPLGALRSKKGCGVGEYADLIPFADFCNKAGLGVIQLLPVNDTGTESSPYSALSAFALHPIYARLQEFPEADSVGEKISALAKKHEKNNRFLYRKLREDKLSLLREMYETHAKTIEQDAVLTSWIAQNNWIIPYAVFMELKRIHNEASWKEWGTKRPTLKQITAEWENPQKKHAHLFFAWLQMRLDEQFKTAAEYVRSRGIILKGDIPILMNEDSCDIWANPRYFSEKLRAGAPIDATNALGQNWGFPIYNWENLKKDKYSWWKERLMHAGRYYDAYRIDHVLGFFRIWAVPENDFTAVLGRPDPYEPITTAELNEAGFAEDRIRWLSKPHIPTALVQQAAGGDYNTACDALSRVAQRIGGEELWLFSDFITGERDIARLIPENEQQNALTSAWRDRTLTETEDGFFSPLWTYRQTTAWQSLSENEKNALDELVNKKNRLMEECWLKQAENILGTLVSSVPMLACAEDLGAGVPGMSDLLCKLGILSLRVPRWTRDWGSDGQPYIPFSAYPANSVITLSVHDSSTTRGWWLNENSGPDFLKSFPAQHTDKTAFENGEPIKTDEFTPKTAEYLLKTAALSASRLCIHPLQDFLYLDSSLYQERAEDERINIPGSVTEFNWTYRLPVTVDALLKNTALCQKIAEIAKKHELTAAKVKKDC